MGNISNVENIVRNFVKMPFSLRLTDIYLLVHLLFSSLFICVLFPHTCLSMCNSNPPYFSLFSLGGPDGTHACGVPRPRCHGEAATELRC